MPNRRDHHRSLNLAAVDRIDNMMIALWTVIATAALAVVGYVLKALHDWGKRVSDSLTEIKVNTAATTAEQRNTAARTERAHRRISEHDSQIQEHGRELAELKGKLA